MKNYTTHESFIVRVSKIHNAGIGVFVLHDIAKNTELELFSDLFDDKEVLRDPNSVPKELQIYCLDREDDKLLCPGAFNRLDIGNYLNHSLKNANITRKKDSIKLIAKRDIKKGEELLLNYNELGEPDFKKDDYYFE